MGVNSFNEWDPLREVVVGSPLNYSIPELDLSFKLFFHDNAHMAFYYPSYGSGGRKSEQGGQPAQTPTSFALKRRYLDELAEDVEGLVTTLRQLGVCVHRPTALDAVIDFTTPYWQASCVPALNVRDQAIVFGNEIVETTPQIRARYFENDLLKPVFYHYFKAGSRWTSMPRPILTDRSFDLSYVREVGRSMVASEVIYEQQSTSFDVGHELMLDGAQCVRFGKDILVNVATENHELGLQWLERHLEGRFRLHRLYRMTDNHIDSIVLPLRPGTLLLRAPHFLELLPAPLRKWDIIYPPEPSENIFPNYENDDLILTSKYIDLNVLSVDEKLVIVNSLFPELIKTLEQHGFTPVPVRHRHRRIFGGGFHCFTLDTVRAGGLQNYFD